MAVSRSALGLLDSFDQQSNATNLDRDEDRIIKVNYACRGVREAFDQCFVGSVIELLPFAPSAGRADEKPNIPCRKDIAKQNACLREKCLGTMIGCVGERANRLSQQVEMDSLSLLCAPYARSCSCTLLPRGSELEIAIVRLCGFFFAMQH